MTAQIMGRRGRTGVTIAMAAFAWVTVRSAFSGGLFHIQTGSSPSVFEFQASKKLDVRVDTGTLYAGPSGELTSVCSLLAADEGKKPAWDGWAQLEGPRVAAMPGPDQQPIYAVRLADGAAVCIANHTSSRLEINLIVHLPAGVYSIDRLGFACEPNGPSPSVERLSGRVLSSSDSIKKPGWLAAGTASIYKFTNHTARTNILYHKLRGELASLKQSSPQAYRRIMVPLNECWDHVGPVTSGNRIQSEASLKHIHRALLTLAHAQSMAKNFKGEGAANAKISTAIATDLDGLQKSLTELSMGCLGLVPGTAVSTPDAGDPLVRKVTVSVANQGGASVSFVRLGAAAPSGCRVWPQEEAMFDSLKPGETARASFTIRLADETAARGVLANVGYFTQRTPAHLSLQAF